VKETTLGIVSSFKSKWCHSSTFQYVAVARTWSNLTLLLVQIFYPTHPIPGFSTICHEVSIRLQTTDRYSFTASATLFNIKNIAPHQRKNVAFPDSFWHTRKQFRSCHIWEDGTCVTLVYYSPGSGGDQTMTSTDVGVHSVYDYTKKKKKTFCYHCLQSKHFRAAFWNPLQLGTEGVTPVNAFTYIW